MSNKSKPKENSQKANRDVNIGNQYDLLVNKIGPFTPSSNLIQLRDDYFAYIERDHHLLEIGEGPLYSTLSRERTLEDVYVPLLTYSNLPEEKTWERRFTSRILANDAIPDEALHEIGGDNFAPIQIEVVIREKSRVLLFGDPGSGKSTILKHIALSLINYNNGPLPILLPLNAYEHALSQRQIGLQDYVAEYFSKRIISKVALDPLIKAALEKGKAVILLDGLDEVQNNRATLVREIEIFADEVVSQGNRVLVSSRIPSHRDILLNPKDWSYYTISEFTPESIESFVKRWFRAVKKSTTSGRPIAPVNVETDYQELLDLIQANPSIARLASNPLLLTILATVKCEGIDIPRSRIDLYDHYLKMQISAWNYASALDQGKDPTSLPHDYNGNIEILGLIALRIREENPSYGLVDKYQLENWITRYFTGKPWCMKKGLATERSSEFLRGIRLYSGPLVERSDGQLGFINQYFEEVLSAYGLVAIGQNDRQKTLDYIQMHITDPRWRESILLSVSILGLIKNQPRAAGEIVRAILRMDCDRENAGQNILLAGACLEEVGKDKLSQVAVNEVQQALLIANRKRDLPPSIQRDAGFSLAHSGWVPADLDAWISINVDHFLFGDDKQEIMLKQPFVIQKYPVTNLQFNRFIEDKGYDRQEFWSSEGWAWRIGIYDSKAPEDLQDWVGSRLHKQRGEPYYWHNEKWNNPLAPVVGVTWFEAEACANWFSKGLGYVVRLPTEEEWECAARGIDGREFAWGNIFTRNCLNCAEFWGNEDQFNWNDWLGKKAFAIASTTIVGQFPEGNTPNDLNDLSGNVWEWTASLYEKDRVERVVRGGSWANKRRRIRCTNRFGDVPDNFNINLGFRLVSPRAGSHIT